MDPTTLEKTLEKKCKNYWWLAWILFLTASPTIFNASHITSYVFLGGNPSFFCNVPELVDANWTKEQIRNISSPGLERESCVQYDWNYSVLKDLDFDDAINYTNLRTKPDVINCKSYIYDEDTIHQTIVSEWDLVCDDYYQKSTAQSSIAAGKLFGALMFGPFSDRFGRKKSFIFSCLLIMVTGPAAAFASSFGMFILFRLLIGFACAGLFETGYTILMELTVKNYRAFLGIIYHVPYSFGLTYLPLAAYFTKDWRQLQLAISVPLFAALFNFWFIPESPRWLITRGKLKKTSNDEEDLDFSESNKPLRSHRSDTKAQSDSCCKDMLFFFKNLSKLFSTLELAKRTLICNYLWFLGSLYYCIVALNGSNFKVDVYLYMGLNGIIELPGIFLPIVFVKYFGRKSSAIALFTIAGIAMVVITVLPQGWPVMCVALAGRLVGKAASGVTMIYTSELFPTESRNTATGSCFTIAQFGPLLAPYIVDILGKRLWWTPTILCGSLAFLGALLMMFLPETRNTPMLDTIKEMKTQEK